MKRISVILGLLMVCLAGLYSQNKWNNYSPNTTEGTEFYLTFLGTNSQIGTDFHLDLFIAAKKPTTVTVTTLANSQSISVYVTKDTVLHISNPSDVYLNTPDLINQNVMKVTSTYPIALYMATSEAQSEDASLVLPTYALGQEYVIQTYVKNKTVTEFAVVATSPGWTNITMDPTQITVENVGGQKTQRAAHVPVSKSLYQGEVYYMTTFSKADISGTKICADKNIAVFNGNQDGFTASSSSFMSHQSIPVRMWGKKYVAVVAAKQRYNYVRLTAADSATVVKVNGSVNTTLQPFQTTSPIRLDSTVSAYYIETTKPTICYQYLSSSDDGFADMESRMGSPATMLLSPLEEAVNAIKVSNFEGYIQPGYDPENYDTVLPWSYYVNLVVPTANVNNMVMDNMPLTTGFQPVTGLPGYSYRKVPVTAGSHEFTNQSGKFVATVYQESNAHSYAYNAGLNTMNLDAYMLLNGNRVSRISVCKDSANSWSGNFQAVVNGPYNSINWYDEYEDNWRYMGSSSSFHYNFQDSDLHHIYMVVNRPSLVCNENRNDTVWADFVCAMTYNKTHVITYACKGDTVRFFENDENPIVLWTDTMKTNKEYQYKRRYESSLGCDSVVIEKLKILNPQKQVINKEICEGESYRFGDKNYRYGDTIITTTGRYTQTWYEQDLCPYEVELNLKVNPVYFIPETVIHCNNTGTFVWKGHKDPTDSTGTKDIRCLKSGVYYDSLKTKKGCDSIHQLTFQIVPSYRTKDTVRICDNELPYVWRGRNFTKSGTYHDSLKTYYNCDSVFNLTLIVNPTFYHHDTIRINDKGQFSWQGKVYYGRDYSVGWHDTLQSYSTVNGCDSIYYLRFKVDSTYLRISTHEMCQDESYVWQGRTISNKKAGTYQIYDSLKSVLGNDSVIRLDLTVYPTYNEDYIDTICQGISYIPGRNIQLQDWKKDIVGVHDTTIYYKTSHLCDSTVNYKVYVRPVYNNDTTINICTNGSCVWQGQTFSNLEAGTYDYYDNHKTKAGCDSNFHLTLVVLDTIVNTTTHQMSDQEHFTWQGVVFRGTKYNGQADSTLEVGHYVMNKYFSSVASHCDSIERLVIDVFETYIDEIKGEVCQYDYYTNGDIRVKHDTVGVYSHTFRLKTAHQYDSIVNLQLTVNPVYNHYDTAYVCKNDLPYVWHRGPGDESPVTLTEDTETGTYPHIYTYKTNKGCDSTYHLLLHVMDTIVVTMDTTICDIEQFVWDGRTYGGNKAEGVDSVLKLGYSEYMHRYVSERIQCDSVMRLRVRVYQTYAPELYDSVCESSDYQFGEHTLNHDVPGEYVHVDSLHTVNGCDSIVTLHLRVDPIYDIYDTAYVCKNDLPYVWHRGPGDESPVTLTEDTETGTYPHIYTYKTNKGCDSTYHLLLHVMDTIVVTMDTAICDIEQFVWDGRTYGGYKAEGVDSVLEYGYSEYMHRYVSERIQCDSVMRLRVRVNQTYAPELYDSVCESSDYQFGKHTLNHDVPGEYVHVDSLHTVNGCDSIVTLHLRVDPIYDIYDTAYVCKNNLPYVWHRGPGDENPEALTEDTETGTYPHIYTYKTNKGCDSTYHLLLHVMDTIVVTMDTTICDIEQFVWDGRTYGGYKAEGVDSVLEYGYSEYMHRYVSERIQCDSVMRLRVRVYQTYAPELYDSVCESSDYQFGKHTLNHDVPGEYVHVDSLHTVNGCDSIVTLHLRVDPIYDIYDTAYVCKNNLPYVWHRGPGDENPEALTEDTETGTYPHIYTYKTNKGCDSTYHLLLHVMDTIVVTMDTAICDIEQFVWDGRTYGGDKAEGVDSVLKLGYSEYMHRYVSERIQCDSVMRLRVRVNPTFRNVHFDTICQYETKQFSTLQLFTGDNAGDYTLVDSLSSRYGCDSVEILHLHVNPVYFIPETFEICENGSYDWHGREISGLTSGSYEYWDSLKTKAGCDSIHKLTLRVIETYEFPTVRIMCENDSVHWRSHYYFGDKFSIGGLAPGEYTYTDNYKTKSGCDSIYKLTLYVNRVDFTDLGVDSACKGDVYPLCTKRYLCDYPGTYDFRDTLKNMYGCDSVVKVTVNVYPTYCFETHASICENGTYQWRDHSFSNLTVGTHVTEDKYVSSHGCDSIYKLTLTVISTYFYQTPYSMCDYDTMTWRGIKIGPLHADSYVFWDSLKTQAGCDSVYKLNLVVHPSFYVHESMDMCDNETIPYLTHTLIYPPGKYILIDTLDSHYGCDSIVEMTVYVHPTYYFEENETICSNETYTWHGQTYRVSGTYYDRQKTQTWNCDSIYQLNLYVQPAYKFESYRTICDNESIEFQGVTLRDSGSHTFHYVTVNGCDSDYVIYLTVNKTSFENRYVTICDNETYSFAGRTLNKTGIYYDSMRTSKGCDSVITLHLKVNPTYRFVTYRENMCNDTVMFRGKSYNKAGTYYDSLKTQDGCDSVYVLVRTDLPSYVFETDTTLCDCYQMKWRGKTYFQSGTFYDSLKTRAGCDSIYVLYLKYEPTSYDSIYKEICFGESYTVHGNSYSVSGVYYDTLSAINNFDCNVTKLTLSVIMPTEFIKMSVPDICADDSIFIIDHAYKGEKPITYSVYFDDAAINEGFQNQINKPYDGTIEALVPKFDRQDKYVRPDYYGVTVYLDNGVCDPEGYQKEEKMLVRWPSWITEQRWQDVVAVVNDKYNGGYTFSRFDWYVNNQYLPNDRESYIYVYEKLFIGDEVYVKLTRTGESYSIPSCPITIVDRRPLQGHDLPIIVQLPGDMSSNIAKVRSEVDANYSVSDFTGKILKNGEVIRNVETIIDFPYVAGVYLVRFYTNDGRNKVVKVVIK